MRKNEKKEISDGGMTISSVFPQTHQGTYNLSNSYATANVCTRVYLGGSREEDKSEIQ